MTKHTSLGYCLQCRSVQDVHPKNKQIIANIIRYTRYEQLNLRQKIRYKVLEIDLTAP